MDLVVSDFDGDGNIVRLPPSFTFRVVWAKGKGVFGIRSRSFLSVEALK